MTPDFSQKTRDGLGKRAAYICSNPDCRKVTAAPAEVSADKAIVIGEAAHIYGAAAGSARFRPDLPEVARSNITNGIWLCRNCHKTVDDDPAKFSAELLFVWQERHNQYVASRLGRSNDVLALELQQRELDALGNIPRLARSIIIEKPTGWEFRLTYELIEFYVRPSKRKWDELKGGLYSLPAQSMDQSSYERWARDTLNDISRMAGTTDNILKAVMASWGPTGTPGEPSEINRACMLLGQMTSRLADWEERLTAVIPPEHYDEFQELLVGVAGDQIERILTVKDAVREIIEWVDGGQSGKKVVEHIVVIELPPGWARKVDRALAKARRGGGWWPF